MKMQVPEPRILPSIPERLDKPVPFVGALMEGQVMLYRRMQDRIVQAGESRTKVAGVAFLSSRRVAMPGYLVLSTGSPSKFHKGDGTVVRSGRAFGGML